jgi:hypothetical protein
MSTHSEDPTAVELLVALLRLLSSEGNVQLNEVEKLYRECDKHEVIYDLQHPLVEFFEKTVQYLRVETTDSSFERKGHFISEELEKLLLIMFKDEESSNAYLSSRSIVEDPMWNDVRCLAKNALALFQFSTPIREVDIWELFCYVAD